MKIQEYQAAEIFARFGLPMNPGIVCRTPEEAGEAYAKLGAEKAVIKAQVLTGGRGKAGGVKLASNKAEAIAHARSILGMDIKGFVVDRVLLAPGVKIASEYYVSFIVDRAEKKTMLMMSRAGGMDIEEVARTAPEKIVKIWIDPFVGLPDYKAREAAFHLFDEGSQARTFAQLLQNLYQTFIQTDASLVEINPLVLTEEGKIQAIDSKMTFDDNALYRHDDIAALFEPTEEEKVEKDAKAKGFSYVGLNGEIGCMVNGAGLAMATMDMIKLYGGNPANFLDIGGSSNPNKVIEAMKLLLSNPKVKVVLINIFGGITRCDDVAKGLLTAFDQIKTKTPIVIRLTGTNEEEGRKLLEGSQFHVATTMSDAGKKAVELSK